MQVTAAVVREKSGPFVIDTLELADPRPDEVLVRVAASGMCSTDWHGRDGYYNTPYPCVYGHEGAGFVEAVGSSVTSLAVGDHVIALCRGRRAGKAAVITPNGLLFRSGLAMRLALWAVRSY